MNDSPKIKRFLQVLCILLCLSGTVVSADQAVSAVPLTKADPEPENRINILLIGQDQRPDEPGKRSDSIILCSFFPEDKKLVLTSVLRDLYVKIPGYGYDRINVAYAMGGRDLLLKTLRENMDIGAEGTVEVDFGHFSQIMDTLGGVPICLREDEAREISQKLPDSPIEPGDQVLNGDQTLAYCRIRCLDPDSDFSRTERQRKVLSSIADQYRGLSFGEFVNLLKSLLPAVSTDLNGFEVLTYGKQILPMLENMEIESRKIPDVGTCQDQQIRGMWVLMPNLPKIKELNQDLLG